MFELNFFAITTENFEDFWVIKYLMLQWLETWLETCPQKLDPRDLRLILRLGSKRRNHNTGKEGLVSHLLHLAFSTALLWCRQHRVSKLVGGLQTHTLPAQLEATWQQSCRGLDCSYYSGHGEAILVSSALITNYLVSASRLYERKSKKNLISRKVKEKRLLYNELWFESVYYIDFEVLIWIAFSQNGSTDSRRCYHISTNST